LLDLGICTRHRKRDHQSRLVVGQRNIYAMQVGDGADEAEAEAASGCRPALVESVEAAEDLVALGFRNTRARVTDGRDQSVSVGRKRKVDAGTYPAGND